METSETTPKRRGRPRSQSSREAILRAAAELMAPGQFAGLTMEGIAARAGVSKQTVYRWWPSKIDVLVEAMGEGYLELPLPGPSDTGDLREDLRRWMLAMRFEIEGGGASGLSQALVGALAQQGGHGDNIRSVLVDPLVEVVTQRFAVARLPEGTDIGFLVDALAGLIMQYVLFGQHMSEEWIDRALTSLIPPELPADPA
ncbi:MAG: TetR/AcrR family transcriptional regulator [Micrococcus sp.]|nr:TetR/AcrR family transcriptional regulator [Micrococcus sp.]